MLKFVGVSSKCPNSHVPEMMDCKLCGNSGIINKTMRSCEACDASGIDREHPFVDLGHGNVGDNPCSHCDGEGVFELTPFEEYCHTIIQKGLVK